MTLPVFGDWPPRERKPMSLKTRARLTFLGALAVIILALITVTWEISHLAGEYNTCRQTGTAPDICLTGGK